MKLLCVVFNDSDKNTVIKHAKRLGVELQVHEDLEYGRYHISGESTTRKIRAIERTLDKISSMCNN